MKRILTAALALCATTAIAQECNVVWDLKGTTTDLYTNEVTNDGMANQTFIIDPSRQIPAGWKHGDCIFIENNLGITAVQCEVRNGPKRIREEWVIQGAIASYKLLRMNVPGLPTVRQDFRGRAKRCPAS